MADRRSRSASPAREEPRPKKQKTGGFKWKEKKPRDEGDSRQDADRLHRGYRDRSPRRDSYRDRDADNKNLDNDHKPPTSTRPSNSDDKPPRRPDAAPLPTTQDEPDTKLKKKKKPRPAPVSNEPMIVVNINDRLGTKAAIPCLASDSVKAFKAMVAAQIGRQPHEIMIKRQGERPFKDQLTLEDYGVSNGVQLDLELDTGD